MTRIGFDDLQPGLVLELGTITVDPAEMVEFARRYDPQPMHLDDDAARASMFGQLSASGWFTACLWMRRWVEAFLTRAPRSQGSPGVRELRWLAPVFADDVLSCHAVVNTSRRSNSRANLGITEFTGWADRSGERVMSCDFTAFFAVTEGEQA